LRGESRILEGTASALRSRKGGWGRDTSLRVLEAAKGGHET